MSDRSSIDPRPSDGAAVGPLDIAMLAEMEALLGRQRLLVLLADFRGEIVRLLLPDGLPPDVLARNVHALTSASGMLGFTALSHACASIEEGCRGQADADGLRRSARNAGQSALDALAGVTARLA
ncbi:Hpt domain-containing protein [Methylobacterium sp. sgz302541]|uniref:Hpt domain-containing protein n=1 Tax=unclassified Methylobacterium TaxID=2615210 RepID=UPI003D358D29